MIWAYKMNLVESKRICKKTSIQEKNIMDQTYSYYCETATRDEPELVALTFNTRTVEVVIQSTEKQDTCFKYSLFIAE